MEASGNMIRLIDLLLHYCPVRDQGGGQHQACMIAGYGQGTMTHADVVVPPSARNLGNQSDRALDLYFCSYAVDPRLVY
jgi:hypothetical protein